MNGRPPPPYGIARLHPRLIAEQVNAEAAAREAARAGSTAEGEGDQCRGDGEPPAVTPEGTDPPPDGAAGDLQEESTPPAPDAQAAEPETCAEAGPPEPPPDEDSATDRAMRDWLERHWETITAMALAGDTPQRPAPPPEAGPAEPPPPPPPPIHVRKGDRWNKPKMVDFLRQLAATHSVAAAARSVGMSRNSAYRLRNRLKGQPFDIAWEAAFRHGYDNLAHAALDRALNGVEVPHYCNGELVGTSRRFDERLTVALLAMRNRVGAPMLGRYGAAAEHWGEHWDQLLERIATGPVDWSAEQQALSAQERDRLDLPDAERDLVRVIARNTPDSRGGGSEG